MGKRFRLRELAAERGVSEEWYIDYIVVPMVNTLGQAEAARKVGVSQGTVSDWLNERYNRHIWWLKKMSPADKASIDRVVAKVKAEQEESA